MEHLYLTALKYLCTVLYYKPVVAYCNYLARTMLWQTPFSSQSSFPTKVTSVKTLQTEIHTLKKYVAI